MGNITYFLGAGASANALPLYSDFKKRLEVFKDYVYHYAKEKNLLGLGTKEDLYIAQLEYLINRLDDKETTTLDAYAHELYNSTTHTSNLSFHNLKYLISDFFMFEQLEKEAPLYKKKKADLDSLDGFEHYDSDITQRVNTHIDKRYRSFINSELVSGTLSSKIRIISWNYDLQLELAYRRIKDFSLSLSQSELQVFPSPETMRGIDIQRPSIIKLNGTAGIYYPENSKNNLNNFINGDTRFQDAYLESMIEIFKNNYSRIFGGYPFFTFSFEKDRREIINRAIEYAKEVLSNTDTLIVIGYSFHPLNREVDRKVFEQASNLKNIIIQVPTRNDFEQIQYQLSKIVTSNIHIEHNPYVHEFHSPSNI